MQLEERAVEGVIVLAPSGRMTRNESFGAVKHRLHDLVQEGRRTLVLEVLVSGSSVLLADSWQSRRGRTRRPGRSQDTDTTDSPAEGK